MEHEPVNLVSPGAEQDFEIAVDACVSLTALKQVTHWCQCEANELWVGSGDAYGEDFAEF